MQARVEKTPTIQTSFHITQKTVTSLSSNPEDAQDKCSSSPNPISLVLVNSLDVQPASWEQSGHLQPEEVLMQRDAVLAIGSPAGIL